LPDGSFLNLGEEAWKTSEILFDPSLIGVETYLKVWKNWVYLIK
jgi:hypothetical protein